MEHELEGHYDQPCCETPTHCERFLADNCVVIITLTLEVFALVQEVRRVQFGARWLDPHGEDGNEELRWTVVAHITEADGVHEPLYEQQEKVEKHEPDVRHNVQP